MQFDIGSCISYGIEKFKKNVKFYLVGFLIIVCISIGMNIVAQILMLLIGYLLNLIGSSIGMDIMAIQVIATVIGYIVATLLGFLIVPFSVGYWRGIKKEYEGGVAEISDVFSALNISIPILINYGLAYLIMMLGILCCVIPGILLTPLLSLSIFFLARGEIQGIDALKSSWNTLTKNPMIILWTIILLLFGMLGFFACCVGIIVTMPIAMCALHKLFQQAIGEDSPSVDPDQADTLTIKDESI